MARYRSRRERAEPDVTACNYDPLMDAYPVGTECGDALMTDGRLAFHTADRRQTPAMIL